MPFTDPTPDSRRAWHATLLLSLLAFAWMEWVGISRFLTGRWYLADVGNIHYALVNTLRGNFMFSPMTESNHFGYHFTPFLLLLAPLTVLSAYPIPLVTAYTAALALCPLPLFRLGRQEALPPWLCAAVGVLFLGNVFVGSVQLADHFEAFFILFMLATMAFSRDGGRRFWISALLTLSVKEDAGAWVIAFAAFLWWRGRGEESGGLRRRARTLAGVSLLWLLLAGLTLWMVGSGQEGNAAAYVSRAGGIRAGLDTFRVLLLLFASTGFLALGGGASTLLALVPAPLLLAEFPFTRELLYYYSYPFLPFLMLATVEGAGRVRRFFLKREWPERRVSTFLALFAAAVGLVQMPLPTRSDANRRFPLPVTSRDRYRLEVAREKLPKDKPVVLQFGLWGVTPTHREARMLSAKNITPDATVFLDLKAAYGMPTGEYLELARSVMDEVQAGKRPLLHDRGELYVIGPQRGVHDEEGR